LPYEKYKNNLSETGSFQLKVTPKQGYLHFVVSGLNSRENVSSYLKDILHECKNRGYSRVLIEENLAGPRLNLTDVFQIVSEASNDSRGALKSIAYVDLNSENDHMKFAETVAVNRTLPIMVFSTIGEAENWLKKKVAGTNKSH
jgi:hypothetical protein